MTHTAQAEIRAGVRFAFGENWSHFLHRLDVDGIKDAETSLLVRLGPLEGLRFLDVGSGSGLFSLAARNLGAQVTSFDYDPQSAACAEELRRRYHADDGGWRIMQGSVLDSEFLTPLGRFDVVYSWGVLHHTGDMWRALRLVGDLVEPGGRLFISIYNDQGLTSRAWRKVKATYAGSGATGQRLLAAGVNAYFLTKDAPHVAWARLKGRTQTRVRGMDRHVGLVDWVGGYPFEVAKPEQVFDFYRKRGYVLDGLTTCGGGLGCNEFVFTSPRSE
jgi:2-polyprenyl-3-methyl-5-hydroxy-6-metoxy-1,4-benzoquinol methylase